MHQPVLLQQTIEYLLTDPNGVYVDCTLGGGGHLSHLLNFTGNNAQIIAIDRDKEVLEASRKKLNLPKITFIHEDFRYLSRILNRLNINKVSGILLDLGVSSMQLDTASRGFSYHEDAPLDMRMDSEQALNATEIVNHYSEEEIARIIYHYGEERYARNIARSIVKYRQEKAIDSTLELVDIIKSSVPARYSREKHPARRTFQALRIAVNSELEAVQEVLPQAVKHLLIGGRLCVITFHSLEDRIVKQFMQEQARECICPPDFPVCICGHRASLKLLNRKPVLPDENECHQNPRARSAKLRVAERI
ncbi:MAG: 16S rRNA (cytosine(1402)-N(4))-methyltransferase RsmH [Syntrophomonadaceae bacterium]|nr:16S rRNA (cytosine(1402)-N(4))-methyltransferase RsmH [Syntrophomonadaceae bacterium]MDD3270845.1 16S rRNA (cytosine(1402)-N(4))-methyltransferase RsmH [Syntrophomonadaceae bacterium]MDD3897722.1 16S rRNA (cytosine(1402)-N(4))-methyltransferase RsmH [Syntrophomonadaceae bacterium]MDD4562475.1 16S rRNA (cytosine(1402)-N(4))-methyltransferase RsmH [Syntrophomonadaceae bacterium]